MGKPVVVDLYCGLGGWSDGFLAEGYECVGYDIEAHDYGSGGYPGELVLRDVRSIHGSEFKDAACIVGSSPCQEFSYRAMPWKRAKALGPPVLGIELFNAQFRIQREASEAAGHYIPMVVENVRGAQPYVGPARWHYGSFYLWGDVPALMPMTLAIKVKGFRFDGQSHGSFQSAAVKTVGHANIRDGHTHTRHLTNQRESDAVKVANIPKHPREDFGWNHSEELQAERREGIKQPGLSSERENGKGDKWFEQGAAKHGSRSDSRKAASAMIAKIPFALSSHIARCYKPAGLGLVANG
jgi:hypothetical protein